MNRIKRLLSDKSERNVIINIFSAFVIKGFSMFISLFSMPMYIKYFSEDSVLGLWYTILSILSWINICDLGLGNGMRNRLTEAISLNDHNRGQKYISSTYIMTAIVILPVVVVGIIVFKIIDLNAFFNIS